MAKPKLSQDAIVYNSKKEWEEAGAKLFGPKKSLWQFVCPSCGYIALPQAWKQAGGEAAIAFSCVGRFLNKKVKVYDAFQKGKSPCNYAGGGLFRINPVRIKRSEKEGGDIHIFDFNRPEDK